MKRRDPRWTERLDNARSSARDRALGHGGWVSTRSGAGFWTFLVGTETVAEWFPSNGIFRWADGRFWKGVFDPRLATALGVTAVIQHQLKVKT